MRLERPFVFRLEHARCGFKRVVDIADFLWRDLASAWGRLANMIVKRRLIREWRRRIGPRHLELSRSLDRIPFLLGDDAEKTLIPHHPGAGNFLDRTLVDFDRHGAGNGRTNHPAMHHARRPDVRAKVFLSEHLWRDVVAQD